MAPVKSGTSDDSWETGTTIELIALFLTVPGALAALVTLWLILRPRRQPVGDRLRDILRGLSWGRPSLVRPVTIAATNAEVIDWFQNHYRILQGEISNERQQWAEEMATFPPED
ncbi:hypothetical protein FB567DRAFT_631530 [Paraphoma chrysanthemicola]|uniref:Uncharacterized protein n=1 Tax=Paraphoma chrysanthemicola TaxID=798071 RepID=A0A8K0VW10_9PLEO|nr:hypothetical protein FB567DRAFT_631530 [Paraphoma chrysanthemicola]